MCLRCPARFSKILKTFEVLQKIIRVVALIEAILGLSILTTKIVLRSLDYDRAEKAGKASEEKGQELTRIIVMVLLGLQTVFALILYEGARRKILCLIKAWLCFCVFKLLLPISIILAVLFLLRRKDEHRLSSIWWTLAIEIGTAVFHILEAIFVLAFHNRVSRYQERRGAGARIADAEHELELTQASSNQINISKTLNTVY